MGKLAVVAAFATMHGEPKQVKDICSVKHPNTALICTQMHEPWGPKLAKSLTPKNPEIERAENFHQSLCSLCQGPGLSDTIPQTFIQWKLNPGPHRKG